MLLFQKDARKLFVAVCEELNPTTKEKFTEAVKELHDKKNTSEEGEYSEFSITVKDIKMLVSTLGLIKQIYGKNII